MLCGYVSLHLDLHKDHIDHELTSLLSIVGIGISEYRVENTRKHLNRASLVCTIKCKHSLYILYVLLIGPLLSHDTFTMDRNYDITIAGVKKLLGLDPSKSPGPDKIPGKLLKVMALSCDSCLT